MFLDSWICTFYHTVLLIPNRISLCKLIEYVPITKHLVEMNFIFHPQPSTSSLSRTRSRPDLAGGWAYKVLSFGNGGLRTWSRSRIQPCVLSWHSAVHGHVRLSVGLRGPPRAVFTFACTLPSPPLGGSSCTMDMFFRWIEIATCMFACVCVCVCSFSVFNTYRLSDEVAPCHFETSILKCELENWVL